MSSNLKVLQVIPKLSYGGAETRVMILLTIYQKIIVNLYCN